MDSVVNAMVSGDGELIINKVGVTSNLGMMSPFDAKEKRRYIMKCDCCKKFVSKKETWTRGSILFNGCKNCYDYLVELLSDLVLNSKRPKRRKIKKQ